MKSTNKEYKDLKFEMFKKFEAEFREKFKTEQRDEVMAKIKDEYIPAQRLEDLLPTLDDAQTIYKFMDRVLCKGTQDITIMSEPDNYRLITQKKAKTEKSVFELAMNF